MEEITIPVRLQTRILIDSPPDLPENPHVIVALHGYGSTPEAMLRLTRLMAGNHHPILSLQGPFQHYGGAEPGQKTPSIGPASANAAYNWGIRQHHADAVRAHHEIVHHALGEACRRFAVPSKRIVLLGFSQPVGLNYRFIGTYPDSAGGVAAFCGGVPKDWESGPYQPVPTPILHLAREQDEFFPPQISGEFPQRLSSRASSVDFHMLEGGHRYPSKAGPIFNAWLRDKVT